MRSHDRGCLRLRRRRREAGSGGLLFVEGLHTTPSKALSSTQQSTIPTICTVWETAGRSRVHKARVPLEPFRVKHCEQRVFNLSTSLSTPVESLSTQTIEHGSNGQVTAPQPPHTAFQRSMTGGEPRLSCGNTQNTVKRRCRMLWALVDNRTRHSRQPRGLEVKPGR